MDSRLSIASYDFIQRVQTAEDCFSLAQQLQGTTIAKFLAKENLPATRQGIQKFLKKYEECGTIGRREGAGRKTKISAEVRRLVDDKMIDDDETTAKELQKMLSEHGHHISERTALKCHTELEWTHRGSAYCQMIRDVNKEKRLEWARDYKR